MRWCASNLIWRFIHRYMLAISVLVIVLVCVNQVIHFSRNKEAPGCYQIVSPFISLPQANSTGNKSQQNDFKLPPARIQWSQARFDEKRMLKIYEWVWPGTLWDELMNRFDVCLATQCSVDRIPSIGEVSEKWLGPISLAVYVSSVEEWTILNIFVSYMQRCSALFSQTVSIHLAVPKQLDISISAVNNYTLHWEFSDIEDHPCGQPKEFLSLLMKRFLPFGIDQSALYPQNHMRNIARKTCGTDWVFMTDVDIIPRPNSSSMLQEFHETPGARCPKCAFVIPVYELERSVPYPKTKRQLIAYANKGLARQFHLKIYRYGHWATNYSLWVSTNVDESPVKVSHTVELRMNHYEPFYVSSDLIPAHDERFIGYGFTRSSQVLEAKLAGWRFSVLTPMYAIHWGLQVPQTARAPGLRPPRQMVKMKMKDFPYGTNPRKVQNSHNHIIYTDFVSEVSCLSVKLNYSSGFFGHSS